MYLVPFVGNIFRNIRKRTVQRGTQLIERFGLHVVVRLQTPNGLTVDPTVLSELIGRDALLLHNCPKTVKNDHSDHNLHKTS